MKFNEGYNFGFVLRLMRFNTHQVFLFVRFSFFKMCAIINSKQKFYKN